VTTLNLTDNKKNNVDLVISPVKGGDAITEASIYEFIEQSEFKGLQVNIANVKNAVAELNSVLKPLQNGQSGREIKYQVLERKDAKIKVEIDTDEMAASAEISTAIGGKHLTAKAILKAAQDAGVVKGFSKEELVKLAQLAAKEEPGSSVKAKIAFGRDAQRGKDAKIKHLVQSAQDRILRPKEREDGTVDMRDLGDIICVRVGDALAKKVPLTNGVKGFSVTGTPIDAEPGEDLVLKAGDGTQVSPENQDLLISTKVGLPRIIDNGMEVDEVYKIKNVDVSTGHIKFEGSVIISGDVCEGMKVIASGDITVGGFVESAYLEAGGDITIAGGVIGRKQEVEEQNVSDIQMSVTIRCKGNLFAKYCQYAEVSCKNFRVENQLMHSIVRVDEQLWLGTEEKANGKLIAGYVSAGTSVHAGTIGASAGSHTIFNFDKPLEKLEIKIANNDERYQVENDKTTELKNAVNKLKKLPKDKARPDMLEKVLATYKHHASRMGDIMNEKEQLESELLTFMEGVYVEATERMYQGVQLNVGKFNETTKREYGPSRLKYKERKVIIDPIVNS